MDTTTLLGTLVTRYLISDSTYNAGFSYVPALSCLVNRLCPVEEIDDLGRAFAERHGMKFAADGVPMRRWVTLCDNRDKANWRKLMAEMADEYKAAGFTVRFTRGGSGNFTVSHRRRKLENALSKVYDQYCAMVAERRAEMK